MLNYDILEKIIENIYNINDFLNFRLIDKYCNEIFKNYFKNLKVNIISRNTFINFKECIICKNLINNLIYKHNLLRYKNLISCLNKKCHLITKKFILNYIKDNNIYPYYKINKKNIERFKINNNIRTNFYIESIKKVKNNLFIKIDTEIINKQIYIPIKDKSYLYNINLFWWYLDRSI
jgi:hypothetical protein